MDVHSKIHTELARGRFLSTAEQPDKLLHHSLFFGVLIEYLSNVFPPFNVIERFIVTRSTDGTVCDRLLLAHKSTPRRSSLP